jgi:polyhydroxybutyrate depolymerase
VDVRPRCVTAVAALAVLASLAVLATACTHTTTGHPIAPTPSTTPSAALAVGTTTHTITVDGRTRTYLVHRPPQLANPARLVLFLHGGFGSGGQAEHWYHWNAQADAAHFVVAYPDGLGRAWNSGGGCCGSSGANGVDDVAFITAVARAIEALVPIDANHVYATGISNGGMLAYHLACTTTLFAAIGPDSATQLGDCPHPSPISIIHIHGTDDTTIRYDGGRGGGIAHIDGPPVPDLIATWRRTDGCAAPTEHTAAAVTTSIASCPGGHTVELITIDGAGHQWPGGIRDPAIERLLHLDPPSTALDATSTIWQFFADH